MAHRSASTTPDASSDLWRDCSRAAHATIFSAARLRSRSSVAGLRAGLLVHLAYMDTFGQQLLPCDAVGRQRWHQAIPIITPAYTASKHIESRCTASDRSFHHAAGCRSWRVPSIRRSKASIASGCSREATRTGAHTADEFIMGQIEMFAALEATAMSSCSHSSSIIGRNYAYLARVQSSRLNLPSPANVCFSAAPRIAAVSLLVPNSSNQLY